MGTQYTRIHWPPGYPKQRPQARHLQCFKERRNWNLRSFQLSPVLNCFYNATAAPKKQHWPSAHLFGRKEVLNLLFLSHYKESAKLLAKEVIKERVTWNIWKLQSFFFFPDLPNWELCQLPSLASAHLPCGLSQTQEEMNPCHNSLRKRWCCKKMHISKTNYTGYPPVFRYWRQQTRAQRCVIVTSANPFLSWGYSLPPLLPSPADSWQSTTPIPLLHAMLLGSVSK